MKPPKASNPPETVYLVVGELDEDCDFESLEGVTWCADRQFESDVEYRLVKRKRCAAKP